MGNRPLIQHTVCIDLPGEPVECWAESDITVLLRKHRDVIFDIQVKKGASYTVEATEDWIYDVAKKKRVKQGQFQDGQRFHLWISRDFKGELILKQDGKIYQRYSMVDFGLLSSNPAPKAKPEPIIIAIGTNPASHPASATSPLWATNSSPLTAYPQASIRDYLRPPSPADQLQANQLWTCPLPIKLAPRTTVEPTQEANIFEVDMKSIPKEILEALAMGGDEETALDTNKIATRNWLIGQLAGTTAFLNDNKQWITELWSEKFRLTKVIHKNVGERVYVVFTGNPRLRKLITAARYGVKNEKVLTIAGGAGSVESGAAAAMEGVRGAAKKAGLIALIFTIGLDVAEWLHDYQRIGPDGKRVKHFEDLLGKITIDLAKAGLSATIASVVVGAIVAGVAGTVAVPVAAIVVGTIVVAIAVGYGLDWLDKKTNATGHVTAAYKWVGEHLKQSAEYLEKLMPKDYDAYPMMYMP